MPLPRYQPVKKRARNLGGPGAKHTGTSLEDLDDACLSRIIAHALELAKARPDEPFVGDNGICERNLSLVSRRWYFLTQTQVRDHGVHLVDLEKSLARAGAVKQTNTARGSANVTGTAAKTPRRFGLHASSTLTAGPKTPAGSASARKCLPYGVLSQRNLTVTANGNDSSVADKKSGGGNAPPAFDIRLLKLFLKYKHVQLTGRISADTLDKLLVALDSARVEQIDLLGLKVENARHALEGAATTCNLGHLRALTYRWTIGPKDDASNALLWTIYERAVKLRQLQVFIADERGPATSSSPISSGQRAIHLFNGKLAAPLMARRHSHLVKVVYDRLLSTQAEPANCDYSILLRRVLAQERSIVSLDTNDCSLIEFLIHTGHEIRLLRFSHPITNFKLLQRLVNLSTSYLSIVVDNIQQIGEVKTALENRTNQARCQLNLYLQDQKFPDVEEKVKGLVDLCRLADLKVHISALQRISIDCCHLMWSTGRALQSPDRCIFKISLQTYPIKPNTVNPCEITVPFGRCPEFKVDRNREDVVRHREIMRALKRDCYHQFVKSVRENLGT